MKQKNLSLAAYIKQNLGVSWRQARESCELGKVSLLRQGESKVCLDPQTQLQEGDVVSYRQNAPRIKTELEQQVSQLIIYEDEHLVVINKPSGISSVPYSPRETGTAMDLIRKAWKLQKSLSTRALHVVHRIDKETSGLLVFAKTKMAERGLQRLFRTHEIERSYLCVAHGNVSSGTWQSYLISDRGDGLRGSLREWQKNPKAKIAITHVKKIKGLEGATLCEVQLETGRTHQIRIHFSEAGHPLVGEMVYIRDYQRRSDVILAPRLMLHAKTLGFVHPKTGKTLSFEVPPPQEFLQQLEKLSKKEERQ